MCPWLSMLASYWRMDSLCCFLDLEHNFSEVELKEDKGTQSKVCVKSEIYHLCVQPTALQGQVSTEQMYWEKTTTIWLKWGVFGFELFYKSCCQSSKQHNQDLFCKQFIKSNYSSDWMNLFSQTKLHAARKTSFCASPHHFSDYSSFELSSEVHLRTSAWRNESFSEIKHYSSIVL